MYKTWTASADDAATLARELEAHLNEFATEVISVGYAVARQFSVLAVYRAVDPASALAEEEAVNVAENIIEGITSRP